MRSLMMILAAAALTAIVAPRVGAQEQKQSIAETVAVTATHEEVAPLPVEFGRLRALRMQTDGNLLACDSQSRQIKVISPAGKQVAVIQLDFGPEAIDVAADGTIYCGGQGELAKLDATGKVLCKGKIPDKAPSPEALRRPHGSEPHRVSGIAVCNGVLFVAYGEGGHTSSRSKLLRFDSDLRNPKLIAEDLHGCCQRCDVAAHDGIFYVAENTAHRVLCFDAQGQVVGKWGEASRTDPAGFGSCCNPMNLCFGPDGVLYTSESGLARIKRYTPDGKFLGLVGYVGTERFDHASNLAASCSNIAIAVAADGNRVYVMDYTHNRIRVLQKKS